MKVLKLVSLYLFIQLVICQPLVAEETQEAATKSWLEEDYLFGNLGGARDYLDDQGISIESVLTFDTFRNLKGGKSVGGTGLGLHSFTTSYDLDKAGLVPGGKLFAYYVSTFGNSPSMHYVGDYQYISNIDVFSTTKLYELWYEQTFMDEKVALLVGLHDYNSEFDILNYGFTVINSSFSQGPGISQNPTTSTLPNTTLGARLRIQPIENTYFMTGIYDGLPGDPKHPAGTRISFGSNDGFFSTAEGGYLEESDTNYKKYAFGTWYNTNKYEDVYGNSRDSNSGVYFLGEQKVYDEGNEDEQGLGLFSRV